MYDTSVSVSRVSCSLALLSEMEIDAFKRRASCTMIRFDPRERTGFRVVNDKIPIASATE